MKGLDLIQLFPHLASLPVDEKLKLFAPMSFLQNLERTPKFLVSLERAVAQQPMPRRPLPDLENLQGAQLYAQAPTEFMSQLRTLFLVRQGKMEVISLWAWYAEFRDTIETVIGQSLTWIQWDWSEGFDKWSQLSRAKRSDARVGTATANTPTSSHSVVLLEDEHDHLGDMVLTRSQQARPIEAGTITPAAVQKAAPSPTPKKAESAPESFWSPEMEPPPIKASVPAPAPKQAVVPRAFDDDDMTTVVKRPAPSPAPTAAPVASPPPPPRQESRPASAPMTLGQAPTPMPAASMPTPSPIPPMRTTNPVASPTPVTTVAPAPTPRAVPSPSPQATPAGGGSAKEILMQIATEVDVDRFLQNVHRYQALTFTSGFVLLVQDNMVAGWSGFGAFGDSAKHEHFQIMIDRPSMFRIVIESMQPYHGHLAGLPVHHDFFQHFGTTLAEHITLLPCSHQGDVQLIVGGVCDQEKGKKLDLYALFDESQVIGKAFIRLSQKLAVA